MKRRKVSIFDLDGTLLSLNTHEYVLKRYLSEKKILSILFKVLYVLKIGSVLGKIQRVDPKFSIFEFLTVFSRKKKIEIVTDLASKKKYFNPRILRLLKICHELSHETILLTAAPEYIAETVSRHLNISKYYASVVRCGIYTKHNYDKKGIILKKFTEKKRMINVSDLSSDLYGNFRFEILVSHEKIIVNCPASLH